MRKNTWFFFLEKKKKNKCFEFIYRTVEPILLTNFVGYNLTGVGLTTSIKVQAILSEFNLTKSFLSFQTRISKERVL